MQWMKPYTIESREKRFWFMEYLEYCIMFEDTLVMSSYNYKFANRVVTALNAAYNLGWNSCEVAYRSKEK